jgi:hypothetical protein
MRRASGSSTGSGSGLAPASESGDILSKSDSPTSPIVRSPNSKVAARNAVPHFPGIPLGSAPLSTSSFTNLLSSEYAASYSASPSITDSSLICAP